MVRTAAIALVVACSFAACGGKTPAPKDESSASDDSSPASASSGATASDDSTSPPAAASSAPPPSSTPATTTGGDTSGDIKTGGDDPWLASHQMPPKDVMKTMRALNGKVQACWKAALKNDPSTNGEVKIRFVITNDGKVRVWRDDGSSMSDGDVTQCVGEIVQKASFPKQKSPGDHWGAYSIHFAP